LAPIRPVAPTTAIRMGDLLKLLNQDPKRLRDEQKWR
jgi:hypothetical protein